MVMKKIKVLELTRAGVVVERQQGCVMSCCVANLYDVLGEVGKGYYLSVVGDVFSFRKGAVRKLVPVRTGSRKNYPAVELRGGKIFKLHRLVALSFIPNPRGLPQVDHIDRDTENYAVSNLRWVTASENVRNTAPRLSKFAGTGNPRNKLSVEQVCEVQKLLSSGVRIVDLARKYGVHVDTIGRIKRKETWKVLI